MIASLSMPVYHAAPLLLLLKVKLREMGYAQLAAWPAMEDASW